MSAMAFSTGSRLDMSASNNGMAGFKFLLCSQLFFALSVNPWKPQIMTQGLGSLPAMWPIPT